MTDEKVEIKGYEAKGDLYYPKNIQKDFFFPAGAPVFNDQVYKIGVFLRNIKPTLKIRLEDIWPDKGVKLKKGQKFKRIASFDNNGVHRLLNGEVLPLLIFPDEKVENE